MIISDFVHHKVDAEFSPDNYLKLTVFHRKGEEWITKVISLSPDVQDALTDMIRNHREALVNHV